MTYSSSGGQEGGVGNRDAGQSHRGKGSGKGAVPTDGVVKEAVVGAKKEKEAEKEAARDKGKEHPRERGTPEAAKDKAASRPEKDKDRDKGKDKEKRRGGGSEQKSNTNSKTLKVKRQLTARDVRAARGRAHAPEHADADAKYRG